MEHLRGKLPVVSTHSRLKAAGTSCMTAITKTACFNTQPPEGGWRQFLCHPSLYREGFNTQPPEGGWVKNGMPFNPYKVSTHSRLKAAGWLGAASILVSECFNTQPPEGGWKVRRYPPPWVERFNTQPPEGGWGYARSHPHFCTRFNTQPPEGGWLVNTQSIVLYCMFQHTAA